MTSDGAGTTTSGELQVGLEIAGVEGTYRVLAAAGGSHGERRYRVARVGTDEELELRQRDASDRAFNVDAECLGRIHSERRVVLLPRLVERLEYDGSDVLVVERLFAPPLRESWDELSSPEARSLCFEQIFLTLSKLHQAGFMATRLTPDAFVRNDAGDVQLVDLSCLRRRGQVVGDATPCPWLPPELKPHSPVDERTDIFGAGALFAGAYLGTLFADGDDVMRTVGEKSPMTPVVTQLLRGSLAPREGRFLSVDEMRVLLYQLKNEQARFPRPSAAICSTVGVSQHRYINEDSAGFNELGVQYQSRPQHLGFYCVADGMGGHELGERASQLAVLGSLQAFRQITQEVPFDRLKDAMTEFALSIGRAASEIVCSGAEQFPGGSRMGTTFTGVLVINDELAVTHVGDSRALLVRGGKLQALTLDHSLVASLVRVGQMTEEEAATSDERNVLVRCIDARVPMDESGFDSLAAAGFDSGRITAEVGDVVLIMSDGVWGALSDARILELVGEGGGAQALCDRIVYTAIAEGSDDNSTALVITWA